MRHPIRTLAPVTAALAAGLLLAGCGDIAPLPEVTQGARPTAAPSTGTPTVAASALTLGGPGTACALPVSFGLAEKWTPKAIEDPENPEFAALTRQGPATVRCEVDAKPAGHVGFLRVWTAGKGSARTVLEGFVKAEQNASEVTYKESGSGAGPVTEVTYTVFDKPAEESKEERAFAVSTPKGTVIVHLGGLDTAEHRAMIPAYELARTTLKAL
ncbi:lipoprotein [Streptomyces sp. NPDC006553]|uniref:lipoprotein n=1 Tax=unclassified Streptomyces TaxID=2593676 RepID=UPI0022553F54|nr:lipoprotein [Streptomyces sp. NBC_00233]MCX5228399.1 lipoprotein [Streptomyces sp. NBC_00233]